MANSEQYNFSDFTIDNYRNILRKAKEFYVFKSFENYCLDDDFIILRHDVDYSMHRAVKLAQIEASEGIRSTFFVLLHNEFYNLFEREVSDLVKQIISLGHNIGLHFDSHYYEINEENELEEKLLFEKGILEAFFSVKINSFCFHITTPFTINCNKDIYAGMINAFSLFFQKEIGYCSDSNGYWRFERLEDVIVNHTYRHLQVNTHPAWWQDEIMSPKERIYRCIDLRAEKVKKLYGDILNRTNRMNID